MRDIPGFGVWLAIMTAMSGAVAVLGCGPDKPGIGGPGAKPTATDAAAIGSGDANTATRPPPVQPADGGAERATGATSTSPAGCAPAVPDAAAAPARDAGGDVSFDGAAGDVGAPASGGRSGTGGTAGGGANGAGGRAVSADSGAPGTGGTPTATGGAGGNPLGAGGGAAGGRGGAATGGRPPGTGGAPSSGGGPGSGGAPGTGGASAGGSAGAGTAGTVGTAGMAGGTAPIAGELAIVELLINPASTDTGREWIEVLNRTGHALSLAGLHIADAANDAAVEFGAGPAVLPAGERAVLVQSADATKNGGLTAATAPVLGIFGTLVSLNNEADTISLCAGSCTAGGTVIDRVAWDAALGTGYDGHALVIDEGGKRCPATTAFGDAGSSGTPGATNAPCP